MTDELIKIITKLKDALKWMVDNDETNIGAEIIHSNDSYINGRTWNEINAYWIDGLNRSAEAIKEANEILRKHG